MEKRTRRKFTRQFKVEAVGLVTKQGYRISEAAESLGVDAKMIGRWKRELEEEKAGTRLQPSEREELIRLRRENKRLRQEREILKNSASFFARESG